jgi:zinc transport system substrate-binding protein
MESMMLSRGFILTACLLICGCGEVQDRSTADKSGDSTTDKKPVVVVTSQPLFEMTTLLAGDQIDVQKITPDNIASRLWKPRKEDVKRLQQADLILISGAGYEPWKDRVSLPVSRLGDTAVGYYSQFIRIPDAITHQHGPEGQHAHPGTVWATWLDPELAESQCTRVADLLTELRPSASTEIATTITTIKVQLTTSQNLAKEISSLTSARKITVVGDSPHYHYLTSKLGWDFQYVHWDESQELTAVAKDELTNLAEKLPKDQTHFFLLNPLHPESTASFAIEAGFKIIRIDLCEYPPAVGSRDRFLDRIHSNLERIKSAIQAP